MSKWKAENGQFCWIIRGPRNEEFTMTGREQVREILSMLNELEYLRERRFTPRAIEGDMDGSEISGWAGQDDV